MVIIHGKVSTKIARREMHRTNSIKVFLGSLKSGKIILPFKIYTTFPEAEKEIRQLLFCPTWKIHLAVLKTTFASFAIVVN